MDWVKALVAGADKVTDVLNLGRLVFYTAAGAAIVYPAAGAFAVLTETTLAGRPLAELIAKVRAQGAGLLGVAIVVGFGVATYGFSVVLGPRNGPIVRKVNASPIDESSYPFRYPQLRGSTGKEWDDWLIQEYYRFVEVAAYVPLGIVAGIGVAAIYSLVYALLWHAQGQLDWGDEVHRDLLVAALLWALTTFVLWRRLWLPRVVDPSIEAYHWARVGLIKGLERWPPREAGSANGSRTKAGS
jgi:hypothetical protein